MPLFLISVWLIDTCKGLIALVHLCSALNGKKNMGPLSTSITSLYELKAKENALGNVKKPSPLDRNKLQSTTFKYREHSENENPNCQRSASAVATSGRTAKLQSKKNTSTVVKASKQNSPVNLEKKGVGRQAIHMKVFLFPSFLILEYFFVFSGKVSESGIDSGFSIVAKRTTAGGLTSGMSMLPVLRYFSFVL